MPRSREPADVFYATNDNTGLPLTPPNPEKPPSKPVSTPKPTPDGDAVRATQAAYAAANTPPGPINLELRTGHAGDQTRITITRRVYDYTIEQTDDSITITGYLKPKADT